MKNLFNLLMITLVLILVNSCGNREKEFKTDNELIREKIRQGYYQASLEYTYSFKFGVVDEDSKELRFKREYDRQGRLVSLTLKTIDIENYKFVEETTYYEYEEELENNTLKTTQKDKDGIINGITIECFDASRRFAEVISYDAQGSLTSKYEYTYDKKGRPIEIKRYDKDGVLWYHSYLDSKSTAKKLIKIYESFGNTGRESETILDQHTIRIDVIKEDPDDSFYVIEKYNEEGLKIESTHYSMSGIPEFALRIEWIKFQDNPQ